MAVVIIWERRTLRERIKRLNAFRRRLFKSRIFHAIEKLSDDAVLRLATPRRLARARDEWNGSPLIACIAARRSALACQLIDRGGHVAGDGAVAIAAMWGDSTVVERLLISGANPDEPAPVDEDVENRGVTPLMWATGRHYFDVMRLLLDAGANVNAKANDGGTAAMCTRVGTDQDLKALEMLCPYGPDLTIRDNRGRCMLDEARDRERCGGNKAMRELLERHLPEAVKGRI